MRLQWLLALPCSDPRTRMATTIDMFIFSHPTPINIRASGRRIHIVWINDIQKLSSVINDRGTTNFWRACITSQASMQVAALDCDRFSKRRRVVVATMLHPSSSWVDTYAFVAPARYPERLVFVSRYITQVIAFGCLQNFTTAFHTTGNVETSAILHSFFLSCKCRLSWPAS